MNEGATNRTMPEKCPQCGASLPAGVLAGLCPACLLQQGAAADTATRPEAKPFVPPTVEEVARLFPQLEILGLLGKGGMGAVYKARQPALDRLVALKILPTQAAPDPGFAERFSREARALARLSHPNIVAVFEFGQVSADLPYFIMEFVDGVNLRQLQKAGRLSPREALQIVPQICDALQYAHDEGVVHRDIKPENVLVDRKGRVKIADFGLAKILGRDAEALRLTGEGQVMGTPHYMAPEQVEHPLTVDHRADIFSLGVVFYEMLTGELPLGKFQPPSHKVQLDVRLDEVVLHALEKEPERRYQHVSQVKTDVQRIATGAPPPGQTTRQPDVAVRHEKIHCGPALSLYCLTTALLAAMDVAQVRGHEDIKNILLPWTVLSWIVAGVFWSVLHYSCWKALPEKYRATTPAQALGFLFIPLFNFYWAFITFPKLAAGFNALKRDRPHLAISNRTGVGIAYAISTLLVFTVGFIAGWASLVFVADLVLTLVFYLGITANANLLVEDSNTTSAPEVAAAPAEAPGPQRISRTALAGVIWAPFAVIALLGYFGVQHVMPAGEYAKSAWWQIPLMITILPLVFTAPFGTTLLGWVAIAQIRRAGGRVYGLGLAFFDGVLFPLLALAGLLAWFWWWFYSDPLMHAIAFMSGPPGTVHVISAFHAFILHHIGALTVVVAVATSVVPGYFAVLWAWRKVKRPLGGGTGHSATPAAPAAVPVTRAGNRAWNIAAPVILAVVVLNCVMVVLALRPSASKPALQFRWVAGDTDSDAPSDIFPDPADRSGQTKLQVEKDIVLDDSAIESAGLLLSRPHRKEILVVLTPAGEHKLAQFTAANIGRRLASIWRGRVLSAPRINSAIAPPQFTITSNLTDKEAQQLLALLDHRASGVATAGGGSTPPERASTAEQLAEPPTLRFLAWQDEWKTNQPGAARHPDGSLVTNAIELNWLRQVPASRLDVGSRIPGVEPRVLHLWFSYPASEHVGFNELSLLDGAGKPIQLGGGGSWTLGFPVSNDRDGNLRWFTPTLSPGEGTNLPSRMTLQLSYTAGPLEHVQEIPVVPTRGVSTSLEGDSTLACVSQHADGNAFVAIVVNAENMRRRRLGVVALAKDGSELSSLVPGRRGTFVSADGLANFEFALPLAEVAKFRVGSRPVRTNEWRDVVLPGY
jgi:hypothetical protein